VRRAPPDLARRAAGSVLAGALALALQACATHPPPLPGHVYSGRIAVHADAGTGRPARSVTGEFELSGNPSSGQLVLTSPLGVTVARARWDRPATPGGEPTEIELEANGETMRYATLAEMMQRALGDQLPLPAMFDWLAGRPWPDARVTRDPDGARFEQLGWRVDESRFAGDGLIDAVRPLPEPALHVRVKLDPPDAPAAASAPAPSNGASGAS
jgi:outer membrane lipoprotein LolB